MNGILKTIAQSLGIISRDSNVEETSVQRSFIPQTAFEVGLVKCIQSYEERILDMMEQLKSGDAKNPQSVRDKFELSVVRLHSLNQVLSNLGYRGLVTLFNGKHSRMCSTVLKNTTISASFTTTSQEDIIALRDMKLDKYSGMPNDIFDKVYQLTIDLLITGRSIGKDLRAIKATVSDEYKEMIALYSETMQSDFIQDAHELSSAEDEGAKYWEFYGPEDDNVRPACLKLLEIRYFTDAQKKKAEIKYEQERLFGCRHTFMPITRRDYLDERRIQKTMKKESD